MDDKGRGAPAAHGSSVTLLCTVFFLSGAAALLFETLWFRLAGLAFGNGVWSSAIVLSSFMGGLALGSWIVARLGTRIRRPALTYAGAELTIAIVGVLLVVLFPAFSRCLTPLLSGLLDHATLLSAFRLGCSFLLLLVPSTAMGLTLPLLVKSINRDSAGFGDALGKLYGWNTLGAVAGVLLGESVLISALGLVGTSLCAAGLNVVAALLVRTLLPQGRVRHEEPRLDHAPRPTSPRLRRVLVASFLSGAILLAHEVIWFRFLQLFFPGTTKTFAWMLAVVLSGIGVGGLVASRWLRRKPEAHCSAPWIAAAAGLVAVLSYVAFDVFVGARTEARVSGYGLDSFSLCLALMFPLSLCSGVLFSLIGQAAHAELGEDTRAAGLLTMGNTVGAAAGSILAGFLLIPVLGMERSFFLLAVLYVCVSLLLSRGRPGWRSYSTFAAAAVLAGCVLLFPFGRMKRYVAIASAAYRGDGSTVVASREGLTETIQYLRKDFLGEPVAYRLVTNSFSMAGTYPTIKRYMKAYVYWPVAVHPDPRQALLISFGTGSTAKALTETAALESIVVVDISREILEMASVVYPEPGENPLDDERVEVRVEDGRFYLQATDRRFDIITSEPPPPKVSGVVNLYTQEYFQLIYDRLAEGGVVTYWLPVVQLFEQEAKSIMKAFVNVFGDEASLWTGSGLEWMLVGTRHAAGGVSDEHFARQWSEPSVAGELRSLGFERPGQLGATFLMGPETLREVTAGVPALTDNYPRRLSTQLGTDPSSLAKYARWMAPRVAAGRFSSSPYIERLFPEGARQEALSTFPVQEILNRITMTGTNGEIDFAMLHFLLERTSLETAVLWACGSSTADQAILARTDPGEGQRDGRLAYYLGVGALAQRDYPRAERLLAESHALRPQPVLLSTRAYLLCLDGRSAEARRLVADNPEWFEGAAGARFLDWLAQVFGPEQVGRGHS